MKKQLITLAALALICTGCASTQDAHLYVLSSPEIAPATTDTPPIVINTVSIPSHLDRPPIVTQASDTELAYSEFHRWGGSLDDNIRQTLAQNLAGLLGSDLIFANPRNAPISAETQVDLWITRLTGELGTSATLQAKWSVRANEHAPTIKTFKKEIPVNGEEPRHYVAAQSQLLADLSREIAAAIQKQ
jgi:uncharacterized lipoprotein YmbA